MILELFLTSAFVALVLIVLGLFKSNHSEMAIIGFILLFLISIELLSGTLQYKTGYNSTITDTRTYNNKTFEVSQNTYQNYNDSTSRRLGYYLAIGSLVGFVGVIISLRRQDD